MKITHQHKIESYYEALINRDPKYIGTFFVGVKTTSVFCISICRARKPKKENVEFFTSFDDALLHGYRPCKICRPTENAQETPEMVKMAIDLVRRHPKEKIKDERLREEGISPEMVRRWFKKHYGLTFHAFQRMNRINSAYIELKNGKRATDTAYDLGYESLSGFGYTYKQIMGASPSLQERSIILIQRITTPIGPMFLGASEKGLCLAEFTDRRMLETELKDLQKKLRAEILIGENEHIKSARKQLKEYFTGHRQDFDLSLDMPGSEFQQLVWNGLTQIPYGTTNSYAEQASHLNKPKAVRAVANANGQNRISIIVPCHRIIGKNGNLVGYGGGLERKKWLLEHEANHCLH